VGDKQGAKYDDGNNEFIRRKSFGEHCNYLLFITEFKLSESSTFQNTEVRLGSRNTRVIFLR
jgi:hypothetical protein